MKLGVGTDNYITLNTNYIQELLILLFTDSENLNGEERSDTNKSIRNMNFFIVKQE